MPGTVGRRWCVKTGRDLAADSISASPLAAEVPCVRSSIDDIPDEIPEELIPDALKGSVLNEDDPVATKTGKVLNEFGAPASTLL